MTTIRAKSYPAVFPVRYGAGARGSHESHAHHGGLRENRSMTRMRLALAQVDPTVGDLAGNAALVRGWTRKAADADAHLVLFPEMVLTGYPVEDLVFRDSFVRASRESLYRLAAELKADGLGEIAVVVGYLDADGPAKLSADAEPGRGPRNALALLHGGEVVTTYFKHHLPNYGVFDEDRYFIPGDTLRIVRIGGVDVALTICEDIWQAGGPFAVAGQAGVGLVVAADGTLLARAPQFAEQTLVLDVDLPEATGGPDGDLGEMLVERVHLSDHLPVPQQPAPGVELAQRLTDEAEIWHALVLGLRDYVRKNGFASVVIALSGGIDSSVVAAIACDALGPSNVVGVSMPSQYSSQHSRDDAADLAKRTGLDYRVEPIQPMVDAFLANLSLSGLAVENLQARVRGVILMALSNQEGHLVLTTGNKSELAV